MTFSRRALSALVFVLLLISPVAAAVTPDDYDAATPANLENDHLYAEAALLVDMDSGEALLTKNARVRMYPASTTKIMTLLLALESDIPLDQPVTVPKEAGNVPKGSSVIGIKPGDVLTWLDLLYGFMLKSGNDGSNAIAVLVSGSIPAFVERMNQRAAELGCEGTHFTNAHGYHDENHYTTAQDLRTISEYAMQNDVFREIVGTDRQKITITRGSRTASGYAENRNSLLLTDSKYYYEGATGIKTGHHKQAGWCVVASAERDGVRLMAIVLNCKTEAKKWQDAHKLFNYGFTRYAPFEMRALLDHMRAGICQVTIENADSADPEGGRMLLEYGNVVNGGATRMLLRDSESAIDRACEDIRGEMRIEWSRALVAPVTAGDVLGTVSFPAPDGTAVTAELVASRDVAARAETAEATVPPSMPDASDSGSSLRTMLMILLILLAALVAVLIWLSVRQRRLAARRRAARRRGVASKHAAKPRLNEKGRR